MKKKTTKKKTEKEVVRFRDLGNGLLAEVKKVRTTQTGQTKKYRVQIETLLLETLEQIEKRKSVEHAVLLEELFRVLGAYFQTKMYEEKTPDLKLIHERFSSVAALFRKEGKLKKNARDQALGQFIEALFYFGMPKEKSMPAVSEWLPYSASTIRDAERAYRKNGGVQAKSQNFEARLSFSPHMPMFIEWFSQRKKPPLTLLSEEAFQKMYEIVRIAQKDHEERNKRIRLFKNSRSK